MILYTLLFLLIDIVSKILVSRILNVNDSIMVIKDFFYITYVRNTGAAFSILNNNTWIVIVISLIIIFLIICYLVKNKQKAKIERISYSMILGGAIGNFLDRITYGYVVDFFDFNIFGYNYPIFNLADSFIFIGVVMLIIYTWRNNNGD